MRTDQIREVQRGQLWKRPSSPNVARVMTVAECWVMLRFKGAMPFLIHENEIRNHWEFVYPTKPTKRKEPAA